MPAVKHYEAAPAADSAHDYPTELVNGLPNGPHVLELVADGAPPPVAAIRVYRPPVAE